MQQYKKIFVIIVASLGIALGLGLIAGKIYIGKILKKPETRKEIESIIESALTELLSRPRVFIGAASLKGYTNVSVQCNGAGQRRLLALKGRFIPAWGKRSVAPGLRHPAIEG